MENIKSRAAGQKRPDYIPIFNINYLLDDFLDSVNDDPSIPELNELDILEIEEIRKNPLKLKNTYLIDRLHPFILPFYDRARKKS